MSRIKRIYVAYRAYRPIKKLILIFLIMLVFVLVPSLMMENSTTTGDGLAKYKITTSDNSPSYGDSFTVKLNLDTGKKAVNAIEAHLKFDPAVLEVVNMTTEGSFCTLYTENSFSNQEGKVNIACGLPNPGFTGQSDLIVLTMRSKGLGQADIMVDPKDASVLANDGVATNILANRPIVPIYVTQRL